MLRVKHCKQKKYKISNLKPSKGADFFIDSVRKEARLRQVVKVKGKEVVFGVEGPIVLKNGKFWYTSAEVKNGKWGRHHILISPNLKNIIKRGKSFIRLDSGCLSGMLGDNMCDCVEQLRIAKDIALKKGGIIIHIPDQDGRGWKEYKMAHQRIVHETNMDTITVAAKFWKNKDIIDIRTFDESAAILKALGFPMSYHFDLGTKNPRKTDALLKAGFNISTTPIEVNKKSRFLSKNLKAKDMFFQNHTKEKEYATH